jgi:hypothetical protein
VKLAAIVRIRNNHHQPTLSVTYPPIIGPFLVSEPLLPNYKQLHIPIMGPNIRPREKIAIARPLSLATIRSDIDPAPIVRGAAPTHPARNRNANSIPRFFASSQRSVKMTNKTLQI